MKNILGYDRVELLLRILSGIIGFTFLMMGLGFLILPEIVATTLFFADTARAVGINSLRGDFGGLFLGMSFFCLLGVFSAHRWSLLVPIVFLTLVILGRLTSFVVDDLPMVMVGTLVSELIFLTVLTLSVISYFFSSGTQKSPPALKTVFTLRFLVVLGSVIIVVAGAFMASQQIGMRIWNGLASRSVRQNMIGQLPDGLHVGLAGNGSPLPDRRRKGVCTFVMAGKHLFIIDSGPGSTLNLELMRVPLDNIQAVLLTHLHSDHIGGLGELMLKAWTGGARTEPLKIVGPEGVDSVVQGFNQAYSLDAGFRFAHHGPTVANLEGAGGTPETIQVLDETKGTVVFQTGDLKVTAFLVDHRPVEPAFGYRFDYKGRSVVISGDTLPCESLRRHAEGIDLLLHDAMQPEMLRIISQAGTSRSKVIAKVTTDILSYHTFSEEAARIARDANVRQLVLSHIIPPTPMAFFNSAFLGDSRDYYDGPITVGVDGMLFSMPPNSTKILKKWLLQ
ncbi:MAG: MBL fold metallo-hydrolase [Desulfobacteraceae bacterium]|nr:MAG: MBL fold metallo-hydrolase [Desulfobacteraceae bacterium]